LAFTRRGTEERMPTSTKGRTDGRPWGAWALAAALFALLLAGSVTGCRLEDRTPEEEPPTVEAPELDPGMAEEADGEPGPDDEEEPGDAPVILDVGEPFWVGEETEGAELVGRFRSPEAMDAALDRAQRVASWDGRDWLLGDILVSVDFRGGRDGASWQVAGPGPVIQRYVTDLQEAAGDRSPLLELGVLPLEVRHCCETPRGAAVPPDTP
jgi:hypothetical protein